MPPHIAELVGRDLHLIENHPIYIIRQKIQVWSAWVVSYAVWLPTKGTTSRTSPIDSKPTNH